jgi:light-harvesting complex I chlorophyll a/b binding protein 1
MRTLLAAVSLAAGNGGSNLFVTPMTASSQPAFALAPQELAQMQYVPYAQPVAYAEEAAPLSGSFYAVVGALVASAVVVAARSPNVATLAVSGHSVAPQNRRAAAPMMFFSGDPDKFDPRVNFKGQKTQSAFKTGKATQKTKTKRAVSRIGGSRSSFLNVNGGAYQEASSFVPQFDEVGVLPPLGRWDPLQIREQGPERYRRFVEMEIKHGRLAMAGFLGVLTTYSGVRFPGYLSTSENIKFSDIPGGAISSWAALPTAAWFQIVIFISFCEINFLKQDPAKEPGDVVPPGIPWARYPDGYDVWLGDGSTKQVGKDELILGRTWKLNAERNNGRAAMMGMTGLIIHEALTGNPFFPIGEQL